MDLKERIHAVAQRIQDAERHAGRKSGDVLLVAVSKGQSVDAIIEAHRCGINDFGENYLQEAHEKIIALQNYPICWHFIGGLQANKAKSIAAHFHWVHSVASFAIATRLNQYRRQEAPLNVCLQVNVADDHSKYGISLEQAPGLAVAINQLPKLKLRGLMTLFSPRQSTEEHYHLFLKLNQLMHCLNRNHGLKLDTLSMGMSDDLAVAIAAGATMVRVGRALFGERMNSRK